MCEAEGTCTYQLCFMGFYVHSLTTDIWSLSSVFWTRNSLVTPAFCSSNYLIFVPAERFERPVFLMYQFYRLAPLHHRGRAGIFKLYKWMGSNQRPQIPKICALTNWATPMFVVPSEYDSEFAHPKCVVLVHLHYGTISWDQYRSPTCLWCFAGTRISALPIGQ